VSLNGSHRKQNRIDLPRNQLTELHPIHLLQSERHKRPLRFQVKGLRFKVQKLKSSKVQESKG
jgi:hypothetical protein